MAYKRNIEYRYYEIPKDEDVLVLTGPKWNKEYGEGPEKLHFHNFYEVGICYSGRGEMILGERVCPFASGSVSMIPQSELHTTNTYGENASWGWMYFDVVALLNEIFPDDDVSRENARHIIAKHGKLLSEEDNTQKLSFLINSIFSEIQGREYMHQRMIRHLLSGLLIEIIRSYQNNSVQDRISVKNDILPAIDYIKMNFDSFIKISELAKCCCMSESHFRKVFERYMNMKPLDYINFVRVQKSCALLRDTLLPVSLVAEKVGYESTSSFIRNFTRIIGCTPHRWRINEKPESSKSYKYNITALKGWME